MLIALQFLLHDAISNAWDAWVRGETVAFQPTIALHVFGGLLIAALVVWRIALRLRRGVPPPPADEHPALKVVAKVTHGLFYVLLVLMAASGVAAWFGGIVPAAFAHNAFKVALLALIALHVVAALFHQFVLRSDVLMRMLKPAA